MWQDQRSEGKDQMTRISMTSLQLVDKLSLEPEEAISGRSVRAAQGAGRRTTGRYTRRKGEETRRKKKKKKERGGGESARRRKQEQEEKRNERRFPPTKKKRKMDRKQ